MSEKGKEVDWRYLSLEEKKEFDLAMAKDLSQVAISKALRNRKPEELCGLDKNKLMKTRWVLTRKSDGTAKARLTGGAWFHGGATDHVQGRPRHHPHLIAAGLKLHLKAGDVTSAFLQTGLSLEDEELNVLAPPELSAMFGAEAGDMRALRVRETSTRWSRPSRGHWSWIAVASLMRCHRNLSALHGLQDSRAGYEVTLAVNQALRAEPNFGG